MQSTAKAFPLQLTREVEGAVGWVEAGFGFFERERCAAACQKTLHALLGHEDTQATFSP